MGWIKYDFDSVINRKGTGSSKWDNVGSRVGNQEALPMWLADMDFVSPKPVVEAIEARLRHPVFGYPYEQNEYKAALSNWVKNKYSWDIQENWIIFSTGVCPVLNTAVQCFTQPGDEVIIQGPVYHSFIHAIEDNGRKICDNSLIYKDGHYEIDFNDLEEKASHEQAKLFILCNPHNPVGRVWTKDELVKIAEICK